LKESPVAAGTGRARPNLHQQAREIQPAYDLSNLRTEQADLWIHLQVDAIFGQIMADQAERLGFPLVQGAALFPP